MASPRLHICATFIMSEQFDAAASVPHIKLNQLFRLAVSEKIPARWGHRGAVNMDYPKLLRCLWELRTNGSSTTERELCAIWRCVFPPDKPLIEDKGSFQVPTAVESLKLLIWMWFLLLSPTWIELSRTFLERVTLKTFQAPSGRHHGCKNQWPFSMSLIHTFRQKTSWSHQLNEQHVLTHLQRVRKWSLLKSSQRLGETHRLFTNYCHSLYLQCVTLNLFQQIQTPDWVHTLIIS